jgi:hypothetical protein
MYRAIRLSVLALSLVSAGKAIAETEFEQKVRDGFARHPGYSLVFMDVRLVEDGSKTHDCSKFNVYLSSEHGLSLIRLGRTETSLFGRSIVGATSGGADLLAPGTYTVGYVTCSQYLNLRGEFARFRVGPDEIVNLGSLVIDFTRNQQQFMQKATFTGRTRVEDLSDNAKASLTERSPAIFPKAMKRYMVANPATSGSPSRSPAKGNQAAPPIRSAAPATRHGD